MNFKIPRIEPIILEEQDKMGYRNAAKRLSIILDNTELPNCFGIYGIWGSGKTSLMQLTKARIDNETEYNTRIATVWFNPWEFEYENDTPLIYQLLLQIQKTLNDEKELKSLIKKSVKAFSSFSIGTGMTLMEIAMKGLSGTDESVENLEKNLNRADDLIYSKYESWSNDITTFKDEYKKKLQLALKNSKKEKIFIFIDDMDRCTQENAVKLLEVLKTYLSVDNVMFVIGVDQRMLINHINHKYQADYGKEYLNKIIPFSIQISGNDSSNIIRAMLNNVEGLILSEDVIQMIIYYLNENCKNNIRLIFTIFNSFLIALTNLDINSLSEELSRSLRDRQNSDYTIAYDTVVILILRWCIIRNFFPELFNNIEWQGTYENMINIEHESYNRVLFKIQNGISLRNGKMHDLAPILFDPFPVVLEEFIGSGMFKEVKK